MSTETPLNARQQLVKELVDELLDLVDFPSDIEEHTIVRWEKKIDEFARAVLAEAERALRERAANPKTGVNPDGLAWKAKSAGLTEAADLLAGMRR